METPCPMKSSKNTYTIKNLFMMLNLSKRSLSSKKGRRLRSQMVIKRMIKKLRSVKIERGKK